MLGNQSVVVSESNQICVLSKRSTLRGSERRRSAAQPRDARLVDGRAGPAGAAEPIKNYEKSVGLMASAAAWCSRRESSPEWKGWGGGGDSLPHMDRLGPLHSPVSGVVAGGPIIFVFFRRRNCCSG